MTLSDIAQAWVRRYEIISEKGDYAQQAIELFWSYNCADLICRGDAEQGFELIVLILSATDDVFVLSNLSAGPLETLLSTNGSKVIGKIEERAVKDRRFRSLLDGVWKNAIDDKIWDRVLATREERGSSEAQPSAKPS